MSASNGRPVIKIGKKGMQTFQIGESEEVTLDVIDTFNRWIEMQQQFIDPADPRKIIDIRGFTEHLKRFVKELFKYDATATEAQEFLAVLVEEQEKLRDFFDGARRARSFSAARPDSTASDSTPSPASSSGNVSNQQAPGSYCTTLEVMPAD